MNDVLQTFRANLDHAIRNKSRLVVGGGTFSGEELLAIRAALGEQATPADIEAAQAEYAIGRWNDNIEVDDNALVSYVDGTDARWIQAWVYLADKA